MMLRERDYRRVLDAVRDLNAPRPLGEFRPEARRIASQLVACETAAISEINTRTGSFSGLLHPISPQDNARLVPILQRYLHQNPAVPHLLSQPDSPAIRLGDFIAQRAFRRTALYNEVYRAVAIEQQALISLQKHDETAVCITLHRASRAFSDRECALLEALRPHLIQAYDNARCFSQLQHDAALNRTLRETDAPRVLVIAQGRIVFCSHNARRILCRCFGDVGSRVPEQIADWLRKQNDDPLEIAAPLRLRCADSVVTVRRNGAGEDGVLLTLEENAPPSPQLRSSNTSALETLMSLDLTARQSEVLLRLARGCNNAQIAQQMYVSAHTVRHHLEAIYQKLGVGNRNAAAQHALQTLHQTFIEAP